MSENSPIHFGRLRSDEQVEAALGRRLKRRRVELGLNQSEAAERAGLARRTVSSVENGEGGSMKTFIALLRALGALAELESILPDPGPSPIALTTGRKVKERKYPYKPRGGKKKQPQEKKDGGTAWQWGDEKNP